MLTNDFLKTGLNRPTLIVSNNFLSKDNPQMMVGAIRAVFTPITSPI